MASLPLAGPKNKSEYVAQLLLERIVDENLEPGTSFGTEAEILEQISVSRPTLREGLRLLEAQGVLELRPGPKGGIIVTKPDMNSLAHALSVFLRLHGVPFITVLQAREVIEPALAAAAANNATPEDIAELQASIDRMKDLTEQADQEAFLAENRTFHSIIASASANEVMAIFWSTISILASGEKYGISYSRGNQLHVIKAHQAILDAIIAKDAKAASVLMNEHLHELESLLDKRYKGMANVLTRIVRRRG